jgi:membrane protease YdiL (CAAX protease family)
MVLLSSPLGRLVLSLVLLAAIAPVVVWFFHRTWVELDVEAATIRKAREAGRRLDPRIPVTFLLGALSLLFIDEYGSYDFYESTVLPVLRGWARAHPDTLDVGTYEDLYWRVYWGISRYAGYLMPLAVWPIVFKENPLDLGLRLRGFREHAWIYLLCLVIVIPTLVVVSYAPEFTSYYPMYHSAHRSWIDFWVWEAVYVGQFFTLEVFFRGFWLRGARSLGAGAIFAMMVPYVMIHFPKPYLEACGAIVAGIVLGSLSMKTGSIWAGFLIHSTVAILMDLLALHRLGRLPNHLGPYSTTQHRFPYTNHLLWTVWAVALVGLVILLLRRRKTRRG